jgi:DNA-binding NtrC family response regulator
MARIMVLEDDACLRKFVRIFLESHGHTVTFDAGAGHVGLERLKRAPAETEVILSDLRMPIADGFDVLSGARAAKAGPVILMSAYWTTEEIALARDLGAFALLAKPFDLAALASTVEKAAAQGRTVRERGSRPDKQILRSKPGSPKASRGEIPA